MITDKEIKAFWNRYDKIIILWNMVSIFGFIFIPVAYVLKYQFGVKGLWLLNDTVDGDFGGESVLKQYEYKNKSKWFLFWWWWFRNHSWNFFSKFKPEWAAGTAEEFRIIKSTLTEKQIKTNRFTWCTKEGIHGLHYVAYRINGIVYCRYSKANDKKEKHLGAGGDRYICRIR